MRAKAQEEERKRAEERQIKRQIEDELLDAVSVKCFVLLCIMNFDEKNVQCVSVFLPM